MVDVILASQFHDVKVSGTSASDVSAINFRRSVHDLLVVRLKCCGHYGTQALHLEENNYNNNEVMWYDDDGFILVFCKLFQRCGIQDIQDIFQE